jgi:hypothetical protein
VAPFGRICASAARSSAWIAGRAHDQPRAVGERDQPDRHVGWHHGEKRPVAAARASAIPRVPIEPLLSTTSTAVRVTADPERGSAATSALADQRLPPDVDTNASWVQHVIGRETLDANDQVDAVGADLRDLRFGGHALVCERRAGTDRECRCQH